MTEHLQECHQPKYLKDLSWGSISRDEPFVPCICDALRACEKRVLDAAREAVEAIPAPYKVKGQYETHDTYHEGRADFKDAALSAIDVLREESHD